MEGRQGLVDGFVNKSAVGTSYRLGSSKHPRHEKKRQLAG